MFLIEFVIQNLCRIYFCIPKIFKTNVSNRFLSTFWICVLALWIHKGYCVLKKLVRKVCIKDFWYTNIFYKAESLPQGHIPYKVRMYCIYFSYAVRMTHLKQGWRNLKQGWRNLKQGFGSTDNKKNACYVSLFSIICLLNSRIIWSEALFINFPLWYFKGSVPLRRASQKSSDYVPVLDFFLHRIFFSFANRLYTHRNLS